MTHSLYFKIGFKTFQQTKELEEAILEDEEFMELFNLKKTQYSIEQKNGNQPFFYFPDKDDNEEGLFWVHIETGSHVSPEDTIEALHWLYFVRIFKIRFKEELAGTKKFYQFEDDDQERTEREMEKAIQKGEEPSQ